jgi:hypothetical protein
MERTGDAIVRQLRYKHVSTLTDADAKTEEAIFSMRSVRRTRNQE